MKIQKTSMSLSSRASVFHRTGAALLLGGLMMSAAWHAGADQLKTPVMQQGGDRTSMAMPRHGQTQEQVRSTFGQPQGVKGPVGEPPITQWFYNDFVVYFEYNHVVHSVVKPKAK